MHSHALVMNTASFEKHTSPCRTTGTEISILCVCTQWLSWDLANDRPVKGPYRMNEHPWFENLPEPFVQGIDAAFSLKGDSDEAMLFSSQLVGKSHPSRFRNVRHHIMRLFPVSFTWKGENAVWENTVKLQFAPYSFQFPPLLARRRR